VYKLSLLSHTMATCLCATAVVQGSQIFLVKPVGRDASPASPMVYPRLVANFLKVPALQVYSIYIAYSIAL
jgi:hypothetical protein